MVRSAFFIESYKTNTKPHSILDQCHCKLKMFAKKTINKLVKKKIHISFLNENPRIRFD